MKNSILKWLVFLRFFFPELKRYIKILFILQFIFFIGSIVLAILHIDKLNIAVYHICAGLAFWMSMSYIKDSSFKI
tara:strand:- start:17 stop:244 length:228 start_codon:yes stop_codon:yes gene_type:complete